MITRFAPSPTGPLHLGHAFSAILAHDMARAAGGQFLLRIEDTDLTRARPRWETAIYEDLAWLGLHWEEPVVRQSANDAAYQAALDGLAALDLTFACTCNRADIRAATSAPQESYGPDGLIYPGTCRARGITSAGAAIRLNMEAAAARVPATLSFVETGQGNAHEISLQSTDLPRSAGDIVLQRRDTASAAYHLAVVVDDAAQNVTHVVRGEDLFDATGLHVLLQKLLGLHTPRYHHHRLIRDDAGKRLAKRDDARALATYRDQGASPADIRRMVGL